MRHGKRATLKQKMRIKALGLDPTEWLVCKDCSVVFQIVSKVTGEVKNFQRS
ncbi:DUF6906 family protein [Anaerosolibacter sp.]|uniref:DUF6906 family protein n=1 Tax=Anaerosolibacter sp. TaxID=1872527 RepID=UPI0039EE1A7C